MRLFLCAVIAMGAAGMTGMAGCTSSVENVHTPADTQPRPYINQVTNPQDQPQLERTGTIHN